LELAKQLVKTIEPYKEQEFTDPYQYVKEVDALDAGESK
jgi:hypothetical protein